MIPGAVDTPHPGDGVYNFAAFPTIEIDFVLGLALVNGVSTPLDQLIGGPVFSPSHFGPRGLEMGAGYTPDSFPQAIGVLFKALRDGLVAGCTITIEWASTLDAGSGFNHILFIARTGPANPLPNYDGFELRAAMGDSFLHLSSGDIPYLRGVPVWYLEGAANNGMPQKAVVQMSRENFVTGQYLFGLAANGGGFGQVSHPTPQLPQLLYEFAFSGEPQYAEAGYYNNSTAVVRKFKVQPALANQNLTGLSAFTDPNWPYVRALLKAGAVDESPQVRGPATFSGTAAVAVVAGAYGGKAYVFDGSGAHISLPADVQWNHDASSRWSIEARVRWTANAGARHLFGKANVLSVAQGAASTLELRLNNAVKISAVYTPVLNTWVWIAADWDGTTYRLYVNGVVVGSATGVADIFLGSHDPVTVGAKPDGSNALNGAVQEFRYTHWRARYAGAYAVPVAGFPRERFASMESYDPGNIPSGVIAAALAPLAVAAVGVHGVAGGAAATMAALQVEATGQFGAGDISAVLAPLLSNITGNHGVQAAAAAVLAPLNATLIGSHGVAGGAVATLAPLLANVAGTFGVAGDPNFASTVLLLGFEGANGATSGAAFTDESFANRGAATLVANQAQISTAQAAFGTSCLLLDGTGDYITFADSPDWHFGSGNFTVEVNARWAANPSAFKALIGQWGASKSWIIEAQANNLLNLYLSSTGSNTILKISAPFTPTLGQAYAVAADWDGTTYRLYVNGVMIGSATGAVTLHDSTSVLSIGAEGSGSFNFNGRVDETRVTKGAARYASNAGYTPATTAFPRS